MCELEMTAESTLKYRGVLEGFYGPAWTHEERMHLVRHLRGWHMNLYIYAPRNDPYHRTRWDAPYPPEEMRRFHELAAEADRQGVMFSYAISPGTDFDPDSLAHRELLLAKLQPFIDLGCTLFPILYDAHEEGFEPDTARGEQWAEHQARVMNELADAIAKRCPTASFLFCPTQYMTAEKSRYLCRLHELLDDRIGTFVTGVDPDTDTVCPRTFSDGGARKYLGNFGRHPFLWDNFNVRDNALNVLHWSPYQGRGKNLDKICSGIVLNPQNIYLLNLPIFGCMGDYFADPRGYDPVASFARHVAELMGPEGAPFGVMLSKWFTAEWFAGPGSGFLSSENNLPAIGDSPMAVSQYNALLASVREVLLPHCDFNRRFAMALMPPLVASHLIPYANLLTEYARSLVAYCDAVLSDPGQSERAGVAMLQRVDRPETECFRLPISLIIYARTLEKLAVARR